VTINVFSRHATVVTVRLIPWVVSVCDVCVLWLNAKSDRVEFFGMKVTTVDSYFVTDGSSDPLTERETSPQVRCRTLTIIGWLIYMLLLPVCELQKKEHDGQESFV